VCTTTTTPTNIRLLFFFHWCVYSNLTFVTNMYATARGTSKVISSLIHRTQVLEGKNCCVLGLSHQCSLSKPPVSWSVSSGLLPSSNNSNQNNMGYNTNDKLAFLLDSRYGSTPQGQINRDVDFMLEGMFRHSFPLIRPSVAFPGVMNDSKTNYHWIWNISKEEKEHPLPTCGGIQVMNRNARRPKKANKGARPCSRVSRRKKKEMIGRRKR
jgi:hypothetical protein